LLLYVRWTAKWQRDYTRNMTKYVYPKIGNLSVARATILNPYATSPKPAGPKAS